MSIAGRFYKQPDDDDTDWDAIEQNCASRAVETKLTSIEGVDYKTYHFSDRSSITFGSNGYIGMVEHGDIGEDDEMEGDAT